MSAIEGLRNNRGNPIKLEQGATYADPSATALPDNSEINVDGDITANIIVIDTPVETKTIGRKEIIYIVYDSSGNRNLPPAERVINVIPPFH